MIILSHNVRGLVDTHKVLALKRLVQDLKPDVIMLQETMYSSDKVISNVRGFLKDWSFCATNSSSLSKGLLSTWSPWLCTLSNFSIPSGLVVELANPDYVQNEMKEEILQ